MNKKLIIIGSSSFSGSWLVKELIQKRFEVTGISRSKLQKEFIFFNEKKYSFHQLDINKHFKQITKLIDKIRPKIIVNFAAQILSEPVGTRQRTGLEQIHIRQLS